MCINHQIKLKKPLQAQNICWYVGIGSESGETGHNEQSGLHLWMTRCPVLQRKEANCCTKWVIIVSTVNKEQETVFQGRDAKPDKGRTNGAELGIPD